MNAFLIFSAIFLLSQIDGIFAVHGGTNAATGQFPAQVAIEFPNNTFCGGTIVDRNHVLTAANCAVNELNHVASANGTFIRAGILTLSTSTGRIPVSAIFVHRFFNSQTLENNLAIIRTAVNFTFPPNISNPIIARAELQNRLVADGTPCFVTGWNPMPVNPQPNLAFLTVSTLNRDTCNTQLFGRVTERMLCARGNQNNQGVCLPNRGGGLYCNNLLTGVLSFGFGCGTSNMPGVYVQVRMYSQWIQDQIRRTDIPGSGPLPLPPQHPGNGSAPLKMSVLLAVVILCLSTIFLN